MKNQTINTAKVSIKRMVTTAIFACIFLTSFNAQARTEDKKSEKKATIALAQVKYLGQYNNDPVFQLDIDNKFQDKLYVSLRDEDGTVLYGQKFSGSKISKKFQFSSLGEADLKVTISLSSKNNKNTQVYQLSNVSTSYREVVINEVK